ncbi:uncharacterized protein LOC111395036 [Olea europaea var. sylvestris]|uniref:uncharacterized protein LOC111395036 n=1 Tax=Olea europaea var. sylvestris TaxID=158386 RepID=UPI000C1CFD1A|nr:uncharacterized protein LOC111395036 [Olea europaea var. sylvestris]
MKDVRICALRLVTNYKPLNTALQWIRYPLLQKTDLLNRLFKAVIFSKLDMKSESIEQHFKHINILMHVTKKNSLAVSAKKIILDKSSLQRFFSCVNYIGDFIKEIRLICAPLFKRLQKNADPWSHECTLAVQKIKKAVKNIPCLSIIDPTASIIVETDAFDLGFGGVLKQIPKESSQEQLVMFHSGV